MKKALIAVDDTKGSRAVLTTYHNLVKRPEEIVLLHVQRLEGRSLMTAMLSEAEMSTLKESLKGTEHKDKIDMLAKRIITYYEKELKEDGVLIRTLIKEGNPVDEILNTAHEERAELVILGSGRKGFDRLITGSVAREVEKRAKVPVLIARQSLMCVEPYSWADAYAAVSVFGVVALVLLLLGFLL
ncbi:MAG: universal stress protein [Nitrospirae bacterium]|nr:universal stress protein [Nitrospirota bacterium]